MIDKKLKRFSISNIATLSERIIDDTIVSFPGGEMWEVPTGEVVLEVRSTSLAATAIQRFCARGGDSVTIS